MRFVYSHPEAKDRTPGHKLCRKLLDDDPKAFLAQMAQLEKALVASEGKASGGKETPASPEQKDEGAERVLELIEGILERAHEAAMHASEEEQRREYERLKKKFGT
jgi:hypothetical protein